MEKRRTVRSIVHARVVAGVLKGGARLCLGGLTVFSTGIGLVYPLSLGWTVGGSKESIINSMI